LFASPDIQPTMRQSRRGHYRSRSVSQFLIDPVADISHAFSPRIWRKACSTTVIPERRRSPSPVPVRRF